MQNAWNVIGARLLEKFSIPEIISIVGLGGINTSSISHHAARQPLRPAIDSFWNRFDQNEKKRFIAIVAEEMLKRKADLRPLLENDLSRLGLSLIGNNVIPVEILDASAIAELPSESRDDLIKAAQRLRDGDLSGAVSAACGAVDAVTAKVYADCRERIPKDTSFQARCRFAMEHKNVISNLTLQLEELGWDKNDVKEFCNNFKGSLNQGAFVMQTLRSRMGDVHGTKPIFKPLVFDSVKWAEIMLRSLAENDENKKIR